MPTVSIRELANQTKAVIEEVARSGRPALVTQRGKPVAALVPLDLEALEDWILADAPKYAASMAEAEGELAGGDRGRLLDEVLADLDASGE